MAKNKEAIVEVKNMIRSLTKIVELIESDSENTNDRKATHDEKKRQELKKS